MPDSVRRRLNRRKIKTVGGEVLMLAIKRLFVKRLANDRRRSHLVRAVIALAVGSTLMTGAAARAQDPAFPVLLLATGGVFGGVSQNHDVCYAFNAGSSAVAVKMTIRDQTGGSAGPITSTILLPGRITAVANNVKSNVAYSCTVRGTAGSSATDLRGVMDVRDASNNVLINSNLH
jgi:hypothetical protein